MKNSNWEGFSASDGTFIDSQVKNSFTVYCDPAMEVILNRFLPPVESATGVNLLPSNSFWRMYENGQTLDPHTDRASSEISCSLCIGHTPGTKDNPAANYKWGLCLNDLEKNQAVEVTMDPGDMLVYKGCEVLHWRNAFQGNFHAQLFLFYVDKMGPFAEHGVFDTKPHMGLPVAFRDQKKWQALHDIAGKIEQEKMDKDPQWFALK